MNRTCRLFALVLLVFSFANRSELGWAQSPQGTNPISNVAIGPQYDTTHVYVAPSDVNAFVASFLGTFGGKSTNQVIATVTPTSSSTTSQLLQTPVGTVSLFGFKTPIPAPSAPSAQDISSRTWMQRSGSASQRSRSGGDAVSGSDRRGCRDPVPGPV